LGFAQSGLKNRVGSPCICYNLYTIKQFFTQHKRVVLVAAAIVFLAAIFFTHARSNFKNEAKNTEGLVAEDALVGDVLSMDTDKDGVLDWEEGLWGTDPTKADTNDDGVSDKNEIARMKVERGMNLGEDGSSYANDDEENLTQTDKFARELFSTVAALNQTGEVDDGTVADLTDTLAAEIKNSAQGKIFTIADLKITTDNSKENYNKYAKTLGNALQGKYPFDEEVTRTLQGFSEGGDDGDLVVLAELDPVLSNLSEVIKEISEMEIPSEISGYHLDLVNDFQVVFENLTDLKQMDTDPLRSYTATNQYFDNREKLSVALTTILNLLLGNPT